MSVSPDDAICRPVDSQSIRPPQIFSDDDPAILAVHVSTSNVRLLTPVRPEQVADIQIVTGENTVQDDCNMILVYFHDTKFAPGVSPFQPRTSG